jgi:hypothetical protein
MEARAETSDPQQTVRAVMEEAIAAPRKIEPGWTLAVWMDLLRRSEQRDLQYLRYQMRVRLGALLVFVGFAGIGIVVGFSES